MADEKRNEKSGSVGGQTTPPAPATRTETPVESPAFGEPPPQLGKNDPVPEPPSLYGNPEERKAKSDELKAEQEAAAAEPPPPLEPPPPEEPPPEEPPAADETAAQKHAREQRNKEKRERHAREQERARRSRK